MISIGLRTDDKASGSSLLARNRFINTYFHEMGNAGLAQIHALDIARRVGKATDVEPHELLIRVRAPGGDRDFLEELMNEHKRILGNEEYASKFRIFQNSDGSIDGELRVNTNEDFEGALMAFGEANHFPREI